MTLKFRKNQLTGATLANQPTKQPNNQASLQLNNNGKCKLQISHSFLNKSL